MGINHRENHNLGQAPQQLRWACWDVVIAGTQKLPVDSLPVANWLTSKLCCKSFTAFSINILMVCSEFVALSPVGDVGCFFIKEAVASLLKNLKHSLASLSLACFPLLCAGIYVSNIVQLATRFCNLILRQLKRSIRRTYPNIKFHSMKSFIHKTV